MVSSMFVRFVIFVALRDLLRKDRRLKTCAYGPSACGLRLD
jgi:hypothetical protein